MFGIAAFWSCCLVFRTSLEYGMRYNPEMRLACDCIVCVAATCARWNQFVEFGFV